MKLIVKVFTTFIQFLINAVLVPIDLLISNAIPTEFNESVLQLISNFFSWLSDFATWVLSWLPFTTTFWNFVIAYFVFRLTIPLLVHAVKLVIQWWDALKL